MVFAATQYAMLKFTYHQCFAHAQLKLWNRVSYYGLNTVEINLMVLCNKASNLQKVCNEWHDTPGQIALDIYTNTYWHHPLCVHNSCLYYTEWITLWYKNLLCRGQQCLYFSKITHLQKPYICWLDSIRLSPSSVIQRILIEML